VYAERFSIYRLLKVELVLDLLTLKQGQGHPQEIPHQVFQGAIICENFRCAALAVLQIQCDNRKVRNNNNNKWFSKYSLENSDLEKVGQGHPS
jgi:hypothetical protein